MLPPLIKKNDKLAKTWIVTLSVVVLLAVVALGRVKLDVELDFDKHLFAKINAVINSTVSVLLIAALIAVKSRKFITHRNLMLTAMVLSCLFLISYICHHLFTGDTKFGGEGSIRYVYFFILGTHIVLAAFILPFILFTVYRGLIAEWPLHKKYARITFPIWLYVSVTGVVIYLMISPYYLSA